MPDPDLIGKRIIIHASGTVGHHFDYTRHGIQLEETRHSVILGHALLVDAVQFRGCPSDHWSNEYQTLFKAHCCRLRDIMEDVTGLRPLHGKNHIEHSRGVWHWLFADPILLPQPIRCSGKLRIWSLTHSQFQTI